MSDTPYLDECKRNYAARVAREEAEEAAYQAALVRISELEAENAIQAAAIKKAERLKICIDHELSDILGTWDNFDARYPDDRLDWAKQQFEKLENLVAQWDQKEEM